MGRIRRVPRPLLAILAAAAIQAAAWAFVVAPLMAPDEINHMGYVQQLAETGHPPKGGSNAGLAYSTQQGTAMLWAGLTPLVGVPEGRPSWNPLDQRAWKRTDQRLPAAARKDGAGPMGVGAYPPLYYGYEAVAFKAASGTGFFGQVLAARLANGIIYLVTIALTWLLAAELFGRGRRQVVATALVALIPQLAFLGGAVNPDTLLVAVSTAILLASVRLIKRGLSVRRVLVLAALIAAAIMTHTRGIGIIAPAFAAVAIALYLRWPGWRRAAGYGAIATGGAALGGVLYLLTTTLVAGAPAAHAAKTFNVREFADYVWQFWLPRLPFMAPKIGGDYGFQQGAIETFFGQFASLEVHYPVWVYTVLHWWWMVVAAALAGLAWARRQATRANWPILVTLAVAVVALVGLLHIVAYRAMLSNPADPVIAGRYFLPLAPIGACGVAYAMGALPRRLFPWAAGLVVGGFLLLSMAGLGLTAARFYG
jgi:4-amino-4-deoxy-L-arabinose transferase-like glycosyltransferase